MKFRASYSVISLWSKGDYQRAIESYFKLKDFCTPAMKYGRDKHQEWENHIKATNTMPIEFGGGKLIKPIVEKKIVVDLEEWLELVMIADMIDFIDDKFIDEFATDWKTGKTDSVEQSNTFQDAVYALGLSYAGHNIKYFDIYHYDQYKNKSDMSRIWVTDKRKEDGLNWIITNSSEMHNYLLENKLYERFSS